MPALPRRLSLSENPFVFLFFQVSVSIYGVTQALQASKEGQQKAEEVAKLWSSGHDIAMVDAKRLGSEVLEAVLRTQLGAFFAANLMAGCYAGVTLATKALFLGQLTASETSKLAERLLKFAMLKAVFLATIPSPSFGDLMQWLAWFGVMGYFLMFSKLASLRGDALLSSPSATLAQHLRILALLGGILVQDISWIASYLRAAAASSGGSSAGGALWGGSGSASNTVLWLFDATLVALDAAFSLAKYAVHAAEHWRGAMAEARGQEREPWEWRTALVYWLDLAADLTLSTLTLAHYCHLWWLHGLQMQLVDGVLFLDVRYMLAVIHRRMRAHLRYRRLQHQLRHSFPDATERQLAEDPCPICLERMKAAKQLPCSHVVHVSCLCAWLQQCRGSFTCPLCRADLDMEQQHHEQQMRSLPAQQQQQQSRRRHLVQAPLAVAQLEGLQRRARHEQGSRRSRTVAPTVPDPILLPAQQLEQAEGGLEGGGARFRAAGQGPSACCAGVLVQQQGAAPNQQREQHERVGGLEPGGAGRRMASELSAEWQAAAELARADGTGFRARRVTRLQTRLAAAAAVAAAAAHADSGSPGRAAHAAVAAATRPSGQHPTTTRHSRRIDSILD